MPKDMCLQQKPFSHGLVNLKSYVITLKYSTFCQVDYKDKLSIQQIRYSDNREALLIRKVFTVSSHMPVPTLHI